MPIISISIEPRQYFASDIKKIADGTTNMPT